MHLLYSQNLVRPSGKQLPILFKFHFIKEKKSKILNRENEITHVAVSAVTGSSRCGELIRGIRLDLEKGSRGEEKPGTGAGEPPAKHSDQGCLGGRGNRRVQERRALGP